MAKNNNNGTQLLLGIIVGAAATYYLNTPNGKKLLNKITDGTLELSNQIASKAGEIGSEIQDLTDSAVTLASNSADKLSEGASEKFGNAKQSISQVVESTKNKSKTLVSEFDNGVAKAKSILNQAE